MREEALSIDGEAVVKKHLLVAAAIFATVIGAANVFAEEDSNQAQQATACNDHMPRQTVVYLDELDIVKSDTVLSLTLAFKLTSSLMPGERLSIVKLGTSDGTSTQTWTGCWPIADKDPVENLKAQVDTSRQISDAVQALLDQTQRTLKDAMVDAQHPPKKQIIKALSSDVNRFRSSTEPTVRAIVYSDLGENSNLGSAYNPGEMYDNKQSVYFTRGVFYFFGIGKYMINATNYSSNAIKFWNNVIAAMSGVVEAITPDFDVPPVIPKIGYYYDVVLHYNNGDDLPGKLFALADQDGKLIDSWIGISHLTDVCLLKAMTKGGLIGYNSREQLEVRVSPNQVLSGSIALDNSTKFKLDGKQIHF
jgi:hypothetical protein